MDALDESQTVIAGSSCRPGAPYKASTFFLNILIATTFRTKPIPINTATLVKKVISDVGNILQKMS